VALNLVRVLQRRGCSRSGARGGPGRPSAQRDHDHDHQSWRSALPHPPRGIARHRTGQRRMRMSAPTNTASKAVVNLLSRSRIKNRNCSARSPRSMSRLRAC
jgi:hypothetical protein